MKKIEVRISDNVLDRTDWPRRLLTIGDDGHVLHHEDLPPEGSDRAVYSHETMPASGWRLDQLVKWVSYDGTGTHPEESHDLRIPGEKWANVYSHDDYRKFMAKVQEEAT